MHEAVGAGAASVAAQLLAFYREPVRYRPRFIHGQESLAGGDHILKFAQGKFSHGMLRDYSHQERTLLREAAIAFIRQVCFWEGATHYQLLCVSQDAKRDAIKEHYRLLMALIHPDRQDPAVEPWPTGCAQRVNRAYATLCDEGLRQGYDEGLRKTEAGATHSPQEPEPEHPGALAREPRKGGSARARGARSLAIVTGVVATLLFLQVWWVSDLPREHSILDAASAGWTRNGSSNSDLPRFIGTGEALAPDRRIEAGGAEKEPEPFSMWPSLWAASPSPGAATDSLPALQRAPKASRQEEARADAAPPPAKVAGASLPAPVSDSGELTKSAPTARMRPVIVTQQSAPQPARESRDSTKDIEIIVAQMVSYYEAGEADRLMGLFEASEAAGWRGAQARQAYEEFFRATKQRRLRLMKLTWQTSENSAHAMGEALVQAEFYGDQVRLERNVKVELDIALRGDRPKITRLSLFPNGK